MVAWRKKISVMIWKREYCGKLLIQLHFILLLWILLFLIFSFPPGFNPVTRTFTKVVLPYLLKKKCLMQKSLSKRDIFMNELHNFERVENYDKILLHKISIHLSITGSILQEHPCGNFFDCIINRLRKIKTERKISWGFCDNFFSGVVGLT